MKILNFRGLRKNKIKFSGFKGVIQAFAVQRDSAGWDAIQKGKEKPDAAAAFISQSSYCLCERVSFESKNIEYRTEVYRR